VLDAKSALDSHPNLRSREIAPSWHTAVLLAVLLFFSGLSAYSHTLSPVAAKHGKVLGYGFVIVTQWMVLAFVGYGVRRRDLSLRDLIRGSWPKWTSVLRDVALAVAFLIISSMILAGVSHLLHASNGEVALRVLPRTRAEIAAYLLLCATAGFCEEIIFRGYLHRQFTAWSGSTYAGLLLQALLFGLAHGYQGARLMTVIAVFGCLFGLLAQWRQSLRPGMIAHFLQDASAVLLTLHR